MGAKDISKTLTLKDGVSGTLNKIGVGTVRYKKQLKDLKEQGTKTWSGLKTGMLAFAASFFGGAGLISASNNWADAAKGQIEVETQLGVVMRKRMGATDDMIKSVVDLTNAQEQLGVVAYDAQLAGAQELGTYLEKADSIKKLIPAMNNLVAQQYGYTASGDQVRNIATMIGKVMDGQTGALSRYGFTFSKAEENIFKFGTEAQKAALFSRIVSDSVGEMNAALGQTDQGKIKQATDAIDGLKGVLGNTVIFIKARLSKTLMENLPQIQTIVTDISSGVKQWAENGGLQSFTEGVKSVAVGITAIWKVSVGTYNFFRDNWSLIGPIVYGIAGALVVYRSTVALVTAAQWLWNAATAANPIGLLAIAIGALIGVGVLLVQNWETVKLAGMNTWNSLVGAVEWGVNKYIDYSNFLLKIYKYAWDSIEFSGKGMWNGIIGAGEAGVNAFIGLIDTMVSGAVSGINSLISKANSISETLGSGKLVNEIQFGGISKADFGTYKVAAEKPKWDDSFNPIGKVNFGGAKFSDDAVMSQMQKAQQEREAKKAKSEQALIQALDANTAATTGNTEATDGNTDATGANTKALLRDDQSPMDLADGLLARIERHTWAST